METNNKHPKSICIISFSWIHRDARVLREIRHLLSAHYSLSIVGYGDPLSGYENIGVIQWGRINPPGSSIVSPVSKREKKIQNKWTEGFPYFKSKWGRLFNSFILGLGYLHPWFYELWYWNKKHYHQALEYVNRSCCDAILANDWESLPVAVKAAKHLGIKIIYDAHEYAPLQFENKLLWRLFFKKVVIYFIRKYSTQIDKAFTVSPPISERYYQEFGLVSEVLLNVPDKVALGERPFDFNQVQLVHHGAAIRARKLEDMIRAIALSHKRFSLHFLLLERDRGYLEELKRLADKCAPGRIIFDNPVHPEEIVDRISQFHIGFGFIYPSNYNYKVSLPNKFFDYIVAGLAVMIGPSPAMAEIVNGYQLGWVAPTFKPKDMADTLNQITKEQLEEKRHGARKAADKLNASSEMVKLFRALDSLLILSQGKV